MRYICLMGMPLFLLVLTGCGTSSEDYQPQTIVQTKESVDGGVQKLRDAVKANKRVPQAATNLAQHIGLLRGRWETTNGNAQPDAALATRIDELAEALMSHSRAAIESFVARQSAQLTDEELQTFSQLADQAQQVISEMEKQMRTDGTLKTK